MNPTLWSSGIVAMDSYPILDLDQMRMIMKYAMVNAEQKWIGKPSTKLPKVHNIIWITLTRCFFFFAMHIACAGHSCASSSRSHTYREKNYITNHPLPFSPVPPHISMHTHVILFCTKGDHRKWCSYIEGDLFWQHSTIEGKPLFCMKQKENTALFY